MLDGLKPYPDYRASTLTALGLIPAHWEERRAKYLFREVDERSTTGTEVLCSVSHKTGVTPRMASVTMFLAESTVGHKICRPNDVVINTLWAWMAALGVARQIGLVSPAYGVYRPRVDVTLLPAFADHLLRTPPYKREYMARSTGVNASRLRLYPESFLRIPIVLPPPAEQAGIVRFLGAVDQRVNRFIRAKRRLIEVLTEQKQAIITHAVTRGLSPATPLKPSGIDWLGEMPDHWDVKRLKHIARMESGESITVNSIDASGAYPVYGGNGLRGYTNRFTHDGDYALIGRQGALCGNVHFVSGKFWASEHAVVPTLNSVSVHWFGELIRTMNLRQYSMSAAQPGLSIEMISRLLVPVPPIEEQFAIVAALKVQTRNFTQAIEGARREIDLIREYRSRLVADVVTGKIDVRAAAASDDSGAGGDQHHTEHSGLDDGTNDEDTDSTLEPVGESEGDD